MYDKIKMPKALLKKWLAALHSGKYKQTRGTLYEPVTKGFCCLGVLEHCAMDGMVEKKGGTAEEVPLVMPSTNFYKEYHIKMPVDIEDLLVKMNDGVDDWMGMGYSSWEESQKSFKEIADYIEANAVGV